jgi:branched-subunit amino acid aminotransferase/4-amino-4-deoxychorismate lyase
MSTLMINGRIVEGADQTVSAFDAGLQHGVGLFETFTAGVRSGAPWALHLEDHVERLARSARELGLSESVREAGLADAAIKAVLHAGLDRARVRLTLTGGDLNLLHAANNPGAPARVLPTILIHVQPATPYPEDMFERGVSVVLADLRVNPLDPAAGHKTLNYWSRLRELQRAASQRAAEALVFQVTNHLAGGCVSNCILVGRRGDRIELLTPIARGEEQDIAGAGDASGSQGAVLPSPVLPGVVRAWALEQANRCGYHVVRRMISIDDVLRADEVLLTNSSWGVLPVVRVESKDIGEGQVGPIARELRRAWIEAIEEASDPMN